MEAIARKKVVGKGEQKIERNPRHQGDGKRRIRESESKGTGGEKRAKVVSRVTGM